MSDQHDQENIGESQEMRLIQADERDAHAPEEEPAPPEKLPARVDRRRVLDAEKRRQILALVANGSSRRTAARVVGCSHSTIHRAIDRDPDFAEQLARAEHNVEIEALRNLRNAAKKERYWRAAAWLLERTNSDDFAKRKPELYTAPEMAQTAAQFMMLMTSIVPPEYVDYMLNRMEAIVNYLDREGKVPAKHQVPELPDDGEVETSWWDFLHAAFKSMPNNHDPRWYEAPVERDRFAGNDDPEDGEPPAENGSLET
jgi:hypothetical protein